jgi:hypothetical protein
MKPNIEWSLSNELFSRRALPSFLLIVKTKYFLNLMDSIEIRDYNITIHTYLRKLNSALALIINYKSKGWRFKQL